MCRQTETDELLDHCVRQMKGMHGLHALGLSSKIMMNIYFFLIAFFNPLA